jgi:predicted Zn-dependent protease
MLRTPMSRLILGALLLNPAAFAHAKEYGHYDIRNVITVSESATGQHSATVNFSLLDQMLDDLSVHNNNYPAQFDSAEDRQRAVSDVTAISKPLDMLANNPNPNAQLLLRVAVLNSVGHNMDIPGAAEKAMTAFTTLLKKSPDDPRAHYLYGKFLVGAGKPLDAIPVLERAKSLGAVNADYTVGLAYLSAGDKKKALENLEHYARRVPDDSNAPKIIEAIRNGNIEVKKGSP